MKFSAYLIPALLPTLLPTLLLNPIYSLKQNMRPETLYSSVIKQNLGTIFERPFKLSAEQAKKFNIILPLPFPAPQHGGVSNIISANLTLQNISKSIIESLPTTQTPPPKKELKTSTKYLEDNNSVSAQVNMFLWSVMQYYIFYLFCIIFAHFFIKQ